MCIICIPPSTQPPQNMTSYHDRPKRLQKCESSSVECLKHSSKWQEHVVSTPEYIYTRVHNFSALPMPIIDKTCKAYMYIHTRREQFLTLDFKNTILQVPENHSCEQRSPSCSPPLPHSREILTPPTQPHTYPSTSAWWRGCAEWFSYHIWRCNSCCWDVEKK